MKARERRTGTARGKRRGQMRILVAVDFSPESDRALQTAAELAKTTGASATVVHARPSTDLRAAVEQDRGDLLRRTPPSLRGELAAHYRDKLEAACRTLPLSDHRLLRGWPAGAIVREAGRGYDLIVMGTRGGGAVRTLLGSTAQEVLHRSRIPVLVVGRRGARR